MFHANLGMFLIKNIDFTRKKIGSNFFISSMFKKKKCIVLVFTCMAILKAESRHIFRQNIGMFLGHKIGIFPGTKMSMF